MVNEALLLEKLDHLATLIEVQISGGKFAAPEDQYYSISATQGFYLDYKKRKHVYLYSPLAFTILLPDLGATASIAANSWTDISFRQGMQLFASAAQTTAVLVLVRATDETISSASTGVSVLNGNVNGQATMANSSPVVIASDQSTINTNDTGLNVAQGATLGTQTGPLAQASVTTNAPAYTNGQIEPLNQTTAGGLRVAPQISGSGVVGGNGATSAQTQRVTISNDSTGQVTLAPGSKVGIQVGGSDVALANPVPTISQIADMIVNGQGFSGSTGQISEGAAATAIAQIFNNSVAKNILIFSIVVGNSGGNIKTDVRLNTSADSTAATNLNTYNLKAGGAASALAQAQLQYQASGATAAGNPIAEAYSATNTSVEVLTNGKLILLPASANNGLAVYAIISALGTASITISWVEY